MAECHIATAEDTRATFAHKNPTPDKVEAFTKYKKRFAFIVGISRYKKRPLTGPTYDAVAIANVLAERYGFQVRLLVDDNKQAIVNDECHQLITNQIDKTVDKRTFNCINKDILEQQLDDFRKTVKKDGDESLLVFYYSGHGKRGSIVPYNSVFALADLATKIAAYGTHHTLLILDACYSSTISQISSIFQDSLGKAKPPSDKAIPLERAFAQPVVQVIAAGSGEVDDQANLSEQYRNIRSAEAKSLEKHSPFTALLKQALEGRIGIEQQSDNILTGTIKGSTLGHQIRELLTAKELSQLEKINQIPYYGTLAGKGEILLIPTRQVLNPRLVGSLYLLDERYQLVRASAIKALLAEPEQTNQNLVSDALPHLAFALSDSSTVQRAALEVLTQLVDKKNNPKNFKIIISSLTTILNRARTDILSEKAAILLGKLPTLADKKAVDAMAQYIERLQKKWNKQLKNFGLEKAEMPVEVTTRLFKTANPPQGMEYLEKRRQDAQWLLSYGVETILAKWPVEKAEQLKSVRKVAQSQVGKLEKRIADTSSELGQTRTKLDELLAKLVEKAQKFRDINYQYQDQQAKQQGFERRYGRIDAELNRWVERRNELENRIKKEFRQLEDAIKQYLKRKSQKETVLDNLSPDWRESDKVLNKIVQFAEQQARQMCLNLDEAELSDYLLSQLPIELSQFLGDWLKFKFEFEIEKETWYYQFVRKVLIDELKTKEVSTQVKQRCEMWISQGALEINWHKLYQNVLDWRKLVIEIREVQRAQKTLSPTVKDLESEAARLENDIKKKEQTKAKAKQDLQRAKEEGNRLFQEVKHTENTLKAAIEEISTAHDTVEEIQTQHKNENSLLEKMTEGVEKMSEYLLCRSQKGKDCPTQEANP
ncbi:Peptidase C14, caspase catalytic domain protein [Candidatus Thiomargarita nelsonii]|uniref:Peptidase C14, caspase catalytic domain protein n=1 Tax=Candidatus Thiomargarita nelsonii TaxID=1003181 RepID=A0A176S0N7_9GAMM|nr:Peptidase C14, caspase catalytic domain protein [Candidatus Thiomargarita nelsonii]